MNGQDYSQNQSKVDELYKKLGRAFFECDANYSILELVPIVDEISGILRTNEEPIPVEMMVEEVVPFMEFDKRCSACGEGAAMIDLFCNNCGTKFEAMTEPMIVPIVEPIIEPIIEPITATVMESVVNPVMVKRFCGNCGSKIRESAVFCKECGERV